MKTGKLMTHAAAWVWILYEKASCREASEMLQTMETEKKNTCKVSSYHFKIKI